MGIIQNIKNFIGSVFQESQEERRLVAVVSASDGTQKEYFEGSREFDAVIKMLYPSAGYREPSSSIIENDYPEVGTNLEFLRYKFGGHQRTIREQFLPKRYDLRTIFENIRTYDEESYLLNRLYNMVRDFSGAGIRIECKNKYQKEWLDSLLSALRFNFYLMGSFRNLDRDSNVFPLWQYWDSDSREEMKMSGFPDGVKVPRWVMNLSPLDVTPVRHWGLESVFYKPDSFIEKLVNGQGENYEWDVFDPSGRRRMPDVFAKAVKTGRKVNLKALREFGYDYTSIYDSPPDNKFAFPKAYTIMDDIEFLRVCKEVDFNAALQYKAGITQIKVGPENPTEKTKIVTQTEVTDIARRWKTQVSNKFPFFITDGTVKFDWIVPPVEIFTPSKYLSALERVLDFMGVPISFFPGQMLKRTGGGFSSDFISLKPLIQKIKNLRTNMKDVWEPILYNWCKINRAFFLGKLEKVFIKYDENVLKEDRITFEENKFKYQCGLFPSETTYGAFGENRDLCLSRRQEEIEEGVPETIFPYFNMQSGMNGNPQENAENKVSNEPSNDPPGDPGRPSTGLDPTPDPDQIQRQPRSDRQ